MSETRTASVSSPVNFRGASDFYRDDKKFVIESEIFSGGEFEFEKSIRNGYYQHIVMTGVCGFLIINHHDKEILILDTWTSYSSMWLSYFPTVGDRSLVKESNNSSALKRLCGMANFLRCSVDAGYTLTGILLSHMHFDHADDIPIVLELLALPAGTAQKNHLGIPFKLEGSPVKIDDLPPIYADFDSIFYLKTFYWGVDPKTLIPDNWMREKYWEGNPIQKSLLKAAWKSTRSCECDHTPFDPEMRETCNACQECDQCIDDERVCEDCSVKGEKLNEQWFSGYSVYTIDLSNQDPRPISDPVKKDSYWDVWIQLCNRYGGDDGWRELKKNQVDRLYYDDCFLEFIDEEYDDNKTNFQKVNITKDVVFKPGTLIENLNIGNFRVEAYLWDHMNQGPPWQKFKDSNKNQTAGSYQRITAFQVYRKEDTDKGIETTKKTLFLGSAGAMSTDEDYTIPPPSNVKITTDLLIQSIGIREVWAMADYRNASEKAMEYIRDNIKVKDYIVFLHWESFIRKISSVSDYRDKSVVGGDFGNVNENIDIVNELFEDNTDHHYYKIMTHKGLFIFGRMGFEVPWPKDAKVLLNDYRENRKE